MKHRRKIGAATLAVTGALMLTPLASAASAGTVRTNGSNLNVRSTPSTASAVVSRLGNGSAVSLQERVGDWYKVEYAPGKYGYCAASWIQKGGGHKGTVSTAWSNLNLRAAPSTDADILDSLARGETVWILNEKGNWYQVQTQDAKTGWVASAYITGSGSTTSETGSVAYPAISLSISRLSQADSRWGSVKLGTEGSTISRIGCTVTCFAMSETYRTGVTTTPADVAETQSFTAGGALYWPSPYIRNDAQDYLTLLYQNLKAGIPTLLEAKNSWGGKHWVLVDGYTGGDTLRAENFVIRDPALQNRKTLAELFEDYPLYSKTAYYQ